VALEDTIVQQAVLRPSSDLRRGLSGVLLLSVATRDASRMR